MKTPLNVFTFQIQNKGNRTVDIHIDGSIVDASTQAILKAWFGDETSTSYKSFRDALAKEDADIFNVFINSPGGVVTDAMAIHDLLVDMQNKGKTVNTIGRGLIASSATLILLAGKDPEMSENSMFMIHTVSGGAYGTVDQIESYAAAMRKFNNQIVDLYSNRTGMSVQDLNDMMNGETWLTANEAVDKKFISKKSPKVEFKNAIPVEAWPFQNMAVLNTYNNSITKEAETDMKKLFTDFTKTITDLLKGVQPVNSGDAKKDHETLMQNIANAITKPFEDLEAGFETAVNDAVNMAVDAKNKDLVDQITGLETDIENIKGGESKPLKGEKAETPIGQFNK